MHPENTGSTPQNQSIPGPVSADAATSYNRCVDVPDEPQVNRTEPQTEDGPWIDAAGRRSSSLEPPSPADSLSRAIYWLRRALPILKLQSLKPGTSSQLLAELTLRHHDILALVVQALWELRRLEQKRQLLEEQPREHAANALCILTLYQAQNARTIADRPILKATLDAVAARLRLALAS